MITLVIQRVVGAPHFLWSCLFNYRYKKEMNAKAVMDNTPVEKIVEILSKDNRIGAVLVEAYCRYSADEISQIVNASRARGLKIALFYIPSEEPNPAIKSLPFDAILPITPKYPEIKKFASP